MSGIRSAGLKKKMGFMGRESISDASYNRHSDFLFQKMNIYFTDKMKRGHEAIRQHYINKNMKSQMKMELSILMSLLTGPG